MISIKTADMTEISIHEHQIINFPQGLIGFAQFTSFALIAAPESPYHFLQSLDSAKLRFIVVDPFLFRPDYSVDAADEIMAALGVSTPDEALIMVLVTVPPDGAPSSAVTANLMGPLVISRTTRRGAQIILSDPRWKTKHDIMAELAASRK